MFRKLWILIVCLFFAFPGLAQSRRAKPKTVTPAASPAYGEVRNAEHRSEFFYQPEAGSSSLTVAGGYVDGKAKGKAVAAVEQSVMGYVLGAEFMYGLNEVLAFGGSFTYGSLESGGTTKTKNSGMTDPKLTIKGTSSLGGSRVRFGGDLDLSIEKMKVDANGRQTNMASGGMSLAPYVGLDADVGLSSILGARLTYTVNFDRKVEVPGASSDATITDANQLDASAFYEYFMADALLGGAFNYNSYETAKVKNGGNYSDAYNTKGVSLYSRIPVGGAFLVPRVDYVFDQSEASSYNVMTVTLQARFNF